MANFRLSRARRNYPSAAGAAAAAGTVLLLLLAGIVTLRGRAQRLQEQTGRPKGIDDFSGGQGGLHEQHDALLAMSIKQGQKDGQLGTSKGAIELNTEHIKHALGTADATTADLDDEAEQGGVSMANITGDEPEDEEEEEQDEGDGAGKHKAVDELVDAASVDETASNRPAQSLSLVTQQAISADANTVSVPAKDSSLQSSQVQVRLRTYFDIEINGKPIGRIVFELYTDISPRAAENFRALCTGESLLTASSDCHKHTVGLSRHVSPCSRTSCCMCLHLMSPSACQGEKGTVPNEPGREGAGQPYHFKGKEFYRIIDQFIDQTGAGTESKGLLSMANMGPDTNGSHFSIVMAPAPHLDGHYTIFGAVVEGFSVAEEINKLANPNGPPTGHAVIVNCGQLS
eukprot:jgi/Chlat1/6694/Chrsp49S06168